MAAGAGAAAIEVVLDVGLAQGHARGAAVNHAANGRAVGFTKVGDSEKCAEGVAAHAGDYPCNCWTQFSTIKPGILENSDVLFVTTTKPSLRAWAAMCKSFTPIGCPAFSKWLRIAP